MHITSNLILRQHLAPLLRQERLNRGLTPSRIAIVCDLSADTIERIEKGLGVSIRNIFICCITTAKILKSNWLTTKRIYNKKAPRLRSLFLRENFLI